MDTKIRKKQNYCQVFPFRQFCCQPNFVGILTNLAAHFHVESRRHVSEGTFAAARHSLATVALRNGALPAPSTLRANHPSPTLAPPPPPEVVIVSTMAALPISGEFDIPTQGLLRKYLNENWAKAKFRTKKLSGSSFNAAHVKALQTFLNSFQLGPSFPVDGQENPETIKALRKFLNKNWDKAGFPYKTTGRCREHWSGTEQSTWYH